MDVVRVGLVIDRALLGVEALLDTPPILYVQDAIGIALDVGVVRYHEHRHALFLRCFLFSPAKNQGVSVS